MTKQHLRTLDDLFAFLRTPEHDWSKIILLGLNLRPADMDDALLKEEFDPRTAFLGCAMSVPLARKVASRNEYDKTIMETEAAYMKILESSQVPPRPTTCAHPRTAPRMRVCGELVSFGPFVWC